MIIIKYLPRFLDLIDITWVAGMVFFGKAKKKSDWLAIGFFADGVGAASIKRSPASNPSVELCAFFASAQPRTLETLEKVAKECCANQYRCTTFLAGGQYQLLSVDAPNVPADELKTAMRWRLKDMLDFHVDDATIDVLDVPVDTNGLSRTHTMFAVAARNSVIEERQTLFADAKVALLAIDIAEMAQRNISALLEPEGRGVGLLHFHDGGGLLTVTCGGELYLARHIDVTCAQLQDADHERKLACYDKITLELQRSLDHFDRQFNYINVSKLVLAPMASSSLCDYLASNQYMPVEELDLSSIMDLSKVRELQSPAAQQRHFLTLGAALRFEETVL